MRKRPVTYKDWRSLWHSEGKCLGWDVLHCFDGHRVVIDRHLWKIIHRMQRIRARLDLEYDVKDQSWCEAICEMIFGRPKI